MALTQKQLAFVNYYCGEANWNGSEAARLAGYRTKPNVQAARMLANASIRAEIEARIATIMPKGEIITRLAARGRSTLAKVLSLPIVTDDKQQTAPTINERTLIGDDRWRLDLIKAQRTGAIHQIKKLKETKYGTEVEVYDALPALELLAKQS